MKENGYSYVSPQLAPKTNEEIKNKRVKWCKRNQNRDWGNVIFIDDWTFYFKPPRGKKIKMGGNSFEERNNFKQKINWWGAFHQMVNA